MLCEKLLNQITLLGQHRPYLINTLRSAVLVEDSILNLQNEGTLAFLSIQWFAKHFCVPQQKKFVYMAFFLCGIIKQFPFSCVKQYLDSLYTYPFSKKREHQFISQYA